MIRSASCRSCRHCDHRNSFSKNVARCFSPHFPRGRDDLRVVRLNTSTFQVCSLLPQVSVPLPQSPPTREGRRPPQCRCRSTAFHLSSSAPLREPRHFMAHFPPREGRPPRRPPQCRCRSTAFHLSSLCASARAKALYGALIPRGRDDLRPVRLNTSSRQQLSGLLSPLSGFSPVRLNASTPSNFQVCSLLP